MRTGLCQRTILSSINDIRTLLDGTPLLEMPAHDLLRLRAHARLLNSPNIQRPVLPRERSDTTHIVSIVRELVTRKAVLGRLGVRVRRVGQLMPVLALPAVRAAAAREEETGVVVPRQVCTCQAGVLLDVAPRLGLYFVRVAVLAVAASPFVVPDICEVY